MSSIYRKWMIIAILSGCVYVFGYSDNVSIGFAAAPCIQECESNQNECNDYCGESCAEDSNDIACYTCLQSCSQTYFQCFSYAVSCEYLDVVPGRCEVEFGVHCPVINGIPLCDPYNAHMGYWMQCTARVGGYDCNTCPNNEYCVGATGTACTGW